ncbi:uncharacterized protein [Ptychodera flava]|uniref:uncharacterized protein n=1 Tax=Ptychodera flava TaxID=63121 RepID=UPI003969F6EC
MCVACAHTGTKFATVTVQGLAVICHVSKLLLLGGKIELADSFVKGLLVVLHHGNAVEDLDTSDSDSSIDIIEISSDTSEELQPRKVFVLDSSSESSDSEDNSEQSFHFAESLDSSSDEKSENGLPNTAASPSISGTPGRNYLAAFENSCGCEWDCLSLRLSQEDFVVAQHLFEKIGKRGAQENRFTKCDVCVALKEEKASTMDPEVKSLIDRLMEEHNTVNIAERQTYFDHRELAIGQPDKYLSVIVDGMDQISYASQDWPRLENQQVGYGHSEPT